MRKIILFLMIMVVLNATIPTYENVTRLYVATSDRTPDVAGLKYWVNDSGLELEDIARSFFDQPETKAKYYPDGTIYLGDFVDEIYVNLFDRAPDSEGRAYWVDAMYTGKDHFSTFILAVINGAKGNDAVILADKTNYAMDAISDQLPDDYINIGACPPFNPSDDTLYYVVTQGRLALHCTYFGDSGDRRLSTETQFVDDLRHGSARTFYETGQLSAEGDYWNDHKIGTWKYHYIEGTYENIEAYCHVYHDDGNYLNLISVC